MENEYKDPKDLRDIPAVRLLYEGDQLGHQMNQWRDLFNIEIAAKGLSELQKWSILSNRYLLMEREHLTSYKLFNKDEVLRMINDAYAQGWKDRIYSEDKNQMQSQNEYIEKMQTI